MEILGYKIMVEKINANGAIKIETKLIDRLSSNNEYQKIPRIKAVRAIYGPCMSLVQAKHIIEALYSDNGNGKPVKKSDWFVIEKRLTM